MYRRLGLDRLDLNRLELDNQHRVRPGLLNRALAVLRSLEEYSVLQLRRHLPLVQSVPRRKMLVRGLTRTL